MENDEYTEFKTFLCSRVLVYPITFVTFHNLFHLHYAFYAQKIGINFHLKKFQMPFTERANELQMLPSKLLRYEDWEILDLNQSEFDNLTLPDKFDLLDSWIRSAKQKQIAKGILPPEGTQYV